MPVFSKKDKAKSARYTQFLSINTSKNNATQLFGITQFLDATPNPNGFDD